MGLYVPEYGVDVAIIFEGGGRMSEVKIRRYVLLVLLLISGTALFAQKKSLHVIYIGDSITAGAGLSDPAVEAPPVIASDYLKKQATKLAYFAQRLKIKSLCVTHTQVTSLA